MKDVVIAMHSIHGCDQEDGDVIDFTTDGSYFQDGDASCFTYLETEVTGLTGTRTSVIVKPDHVVVNRDGKITGRMVFRVGEKNSFLYETPFGIATLGVKTNRIRQSFDENGGKLEVDYVLDMEHALVMKNKIELNIRQQMGV